MREILPEPTFVRLGPENSPELVALERQCFSLPWTEQEFAGAFGQTCFSVFGLRETRQDAQNELVAYASVYHTSDELEILNIAVRTDRRNREYGRRLLGLVLRIAEKMGIVRAVLEVRVTNAPAIRLYRFFGFTQAGVRRGYYPDTGEDALVYVLDMSDRKG